MKDRYDYILIDCPPSLGFLSVNAIRASSHVMVPVEPSRFSLQGLERLMDIVRLIRDRLNHSVESRILVTMFDSRLQHSFQMMDLIKEKFSTIKKEHGADSIAGFSSARCTNEENYLFQKFIRAVIGTNNVDHCARL